MMRRLPSLLLLVLLHARAISAFTYRDLSTKAYREKNSSPVDTTVEFPSEDLPPSLPSVLWSPKNARGIIFNRRYRCLVLRASGGGGGDGGDKKKGYKFGDFTKSSVEKITGKPYEFGDLSRAIDSSIKVKVNELTGKDDYEFGDLSLWVDTKIKGGVNNFTSKDSYQFGDLTKEIVRRVASGNYNLNDLFMLLKGLAMIGARLSPYAGFLPVKLLVELLDFSLLNDVKGKVTSSLALELDKRLKRLLLGDEDYKLGDGTKRTIANAVKSYTGKEEYEFGDVTKKVVSSFAEEAEVTKDPPATFGIKSGKDMEPGITEALDKWDALSDKQLRDGLDNLEKYVELVENDQGGEEKKVAWK